MNEQCVSASSTAEGQSSTPSHHTEALTHASNSGHRYWHSPACKRIKPKPFGGTGLLKQNAFEDETLGARKFCTS